MNHNYQELEQLFSGYFHEGWKEFTDWQGEKPNFEKVIQNYKIDSSPEELEMAKKELTSLLSQNYSEDKLRDILLYELHNNFRAPGIGLTYQQWLKKILDLLSA